jgi:hypothetical protein
VAVGGGERGRGWGWGGGREVLEGGGDQRHHLLIRLVQSEDPV